MSVQVLRCFVAIELNDEVRSALKDLEQRLAEALPRNSVRWVSPENMHLTLKFLGDVQETRISAISQALNECCRQTAGFAFQVEGSGCFPNVRRPNVIWVGVSESTHALETLQKRVDKALGPLGFPPEGRGFAPHLTLGRTRREAADEQLRAVGAYMSSLDVGSLGTVRADSLFLIRSELLPGGPKYTHLAQVAFEGGPNL